MIMNEDLIISYCLVRVDAPDFNLGKACAQTNHCGTQMTEELKGKDDKALHKLYKQWQEDRTFGTCLTLAVNAAEMRVAVTVANMLGLHAGIVHDPTYPIRDGDNMIFAPVDTCAYIFGRKSDCSLIVGKFPLLHERYVK